MKTEKSRIILLLCLIIILGGLLRFHQLGQESLWTDEIISLKHTQYKFAELIKSVTVTELTPPGYFIFLSYWVKIFGDSEFSLRAPTAILDTLSIAIIFLIGSRLFNRTIGIILALLLSTMMVQIVYAQEARMYAAFGFLSLLSTLFLIEYYQNRRSKYKLFYIMSMAVSIYINYMALFLILFQFLAILHTRNRIFLKDFLLNISIILLLFAAGVRILITQGILRNNALKKVLIPWGIPPALSKLGIIFFLLPLLVLIILGIIIFIIYKKSNYLNYKRSLIFGSLFYIIAVTIYLVFLDRFTRSFSLLRHSFFILPIFYLCLALLINNIRTKRIKSLVIIIILLTNVITLAYYYQKTTKAPWNEAIIYIKNNSPVETLILFDRSGSNIDLFKYYYNGDFRSLNLTSTKSGTLYYINEHKLFKKLEKEKTFWLISSRNIETKDYYVKILNEKYKLLLSQKYPEMDVYYFSANNPGIS